MFGCQCQHDWVDTRPTKFLTEKVSIFCILHYVQSVLLIGDVEISFRVLEAFERDNESILIFSGSE